MVFCTYCGREFGRAEHLQRHILTRQYLHWPLIVLESSNTPLSDTKVRPFSCEICHISFSRK